MDDYNEGSFFEDDYIPEPIEEFCDGCEVWYWDYWCGMCGYHGHDCPSEYEEDGTADE